VSGHDKTRLSAEHPKTTPYTETMNEHRFARSARKCASVILIRPDTSWHVRTYHNVSDPNFLKIVPYPNPMNATSFIVSVAPSLGFRAPPKRGHTLNPNLPEPSRLRAFVVNPSGHRGETVQKLCSFSNCTFLPPTKFVPIHVARPKLNKTE
jgi:hypothetical protein